MGVPPATLDSILALQLSVAWAGEARSQPPRLGWWQTDLVDEAGGADLLSRLVPRTHAWATLEAVREAARRVDERTRRRSGAPDRLLTLFQLGLALDEQLAERIAHHRRRGTAPREALGAQLTVGPSFDRAGFEALVRQSAPSPKVETVPEGRLVTGAPPADPLARARVLVAALAPFTAEYPMPHFKLEEGKR